MFTFALSSEINFFCEDFVGEKLIGLVGEFGRDKRAGKREL